MLSFTNIGRCVQDLTSDPTNLGNEPPIAPTQPTTPHPNATEPTVAWHPIYMSISRHLDEYCAVEGITPSAEVDVEGLSSCHQFLPSPGVDVSTTDPLSRLERARAALAATL